MKRNFLPFIILILCFHTSYAELHKIYSPDKNIRIEFSLGSPDNAVGQRFFDDAPYYRVFYGDKPFILTSRLGFEVVGAPTIDRYFKVINTLSNKKRGSWKPVYGEKQEYPDNYDELIITLQETILPMRIVKIVFRAYNEGIAFRYEIPQQKSFPSITITREMTEFAFAPNTYVWEEHGHEGLYQKVLASDIAPDCELPLTVLSENGIYGAIAEAGNSNYPRAYVKAQQTRNNEKTNTIQITLRGEAKGQGKYSTAWRSVTISDRPGGLVEQNYLILNLSEPNKIADVSWIKPGKAIRDVTLSTIGSKKYIDYAQKQGIDYIILDWGWYGPPNAQTSDPSYVNVVNPGTGQPIPNHTGLNIQEVVAYGKSKGVGIFLYVNRQGLERYMDKFFPIYKSWGIKGIKPGFVNVGNQEWQQWIETMVQKAAKYHLMVNIHDAYRPTGYSRTYPNLIGQEGIHGNEQTPNSDHTTTLPFTRYTIGAADFTPGYCRSTLKYTWTHRLALPIIYYNPGMFLFWGEPLNAECHSRPELALWHDVPVVWDDTKVLQGSIGEFAIIARRTGNNWFVGGITNHLERNIQLNLNFLDHGKNYTATIYTDSPDAKLVIMENKKVTSDTIESFKLLPSGGFALEITRE